MIEASGLTKYYGDTCAIRDLDFTIEKGEIVGFLGPNGAGKTTTLKVLTSLLLPSRGTVKVGGVDVTQDPDRVRQQVGFLPEVPPLYTEMTVEGFLLFTAQLRGLDTKKARERVGVTIELTNLQQVRHQVIDTLSHGFRQRVGISQAIVHDPTLLILDEPTKGLDPVQIVEFREMIRGLKGKHTILLSSHILPEISQTVDRILMLKDGEIIADGSEEELVSKFSSGQRLHVLIRGDATHAMDLLNGLEGIKGCHEDPRPAAPYRQASGPQTTLSVSTRGDRREAIAQALVEGGFGLLHLAPAEAELEAAFLRL
ncbi:MAG: ABC transporter ATP-binding protein, partial [Deltaproteobacteria bacterium]|nr:ABC transporter ATP-binding protein [Deltaproteobacteria bacterium]